MVQIANQQETAAIEQLQNRIGTFYQYLISHGDEEEARKVRELGLKYSSGEYAIAMCGHFSAGKSTLINTILGEEILPSSPIPTSANLVKVKSGEEYAKVYFKSGNPRIYLAPYDYSVVKNYCKDGDQIKELEISHSGSSLPANAVILDTPGIDSADDAHRVATESAIHLADIVIYVMDYNHVQSDLNFLFTKELHEAGKELYLVINQIDKHRSDEISFEDFQKSVSDAFTFWGVKPTSIFYTSLKVQNHPHNQFIELRNMIQERLQSKNRFLPYSIFQSIRTLGNDYLHKYKNHQSDRIRTALDILLEIPNEEQSNFLKREQELKQQIDELKVHATNVKNILSEEVEKILKNAYLMPFQLRALAEKYIETCQPDFKVGLFFSKAKTESERTIRLQRFHSELQEVMKTQIEWHIRELLIKTVKENEISNPEILSYAQSFTLKLTNEVLQSAVKPGARLSGEYVLNYTEEVAAEIKKEARRKIDSFKEKMLKEVAHQSSFKKTNLVSELVKVSRITNAITTIRESEIEYKLVKDEIETILYKDLKEKMVITFEEFEDDAEVIPGGTLALTDAPFLVDEKSSRRKAEALLGVSHEKERAEGVIKSLLNSAHLIEAIPGFQKTAVDLRGKAERLKDKGFTVALFGAFSAGKSSFANALIGEAVLPVSPNPTTAAINKIKPVTETFPHGTVLVKLKTEEMILADVNKSLGYFDHNADNLEDALRKADHALLVAPASDGQVKKHHSFLRAFLNGFSAVVNHLGGVIEADLEELKEFVANEEKSCFVDWIELYYDCELTRMGITLVDTPGADSINTRHTEVAFEYIKNSDAILFVTYYNHAFSRADREFLIQLGRVKDSFQLDKMFFILNAIDLAESKDEKQEVVNYVEEQLVKYGIRNPHLYPLSSMKALEEKQRKKDFNSQLSIFEDSFYHFISGELLEMAISSAESELIRVNDWIKKLIMSSEQDQDAKRERKIKIENEKRLMYEILSKQNHQFLTKRMAQESEELIFYIKQRVFFRFGDFFKEAFNPSVLKEDGRDLKKALKTALNEFLESVGFDFSQEMRATMIRLDVFAEKILTDFQKSIFQEISQVNKDITFSSYEWTKHNGIEFQLAFLNIEEGLFSQALSLFKNPRSFFEKNEKKKMGEEISSVLQVPTDRYLATEKQRVNEFYQSLMSNVVKQIIEEISTQLEEYYQGLSALLNEDFSIAEIKSIQQKLEQLIKG